MAGARHARAGRKRKFTTRSGAVLQFTELGFGGAPLGNLYRPLTEKEARATLDAAWAAGCRYYDTAPLYGLGLSETRLNGFLRAKPRDDYSALDEDRPAARTLPARAALAPGRVLRDAVAARDLRLFLRRRHALAGVFARAARRRSYRHRLRARRRRLHPWQQGGVGRAHSRVHGGRLQGVDQAARERRDQGDRRRRQRMGGRGDSGAFGRFRRFSAGWPLHAARTGGAAKLPALLRGEEDRRRHRRTVQLRHSRHRAEARRVLQLRAGARGRAGARAPDRGDLQGARGQARGGGASLSAQPSRESSASSPAGRRPARFVATPRCWTPRFRRRCGALSRPKGCCAPTRRRRVETIRGAACDAESDRSAVDPGSSLCPAPRWGTATKSPSSTPIIPRNRRDPTSSGSTPPTRRARSTPCSASCRSTPSLPRRAGACRSSAPPPATPSRRSSPSFAPSSPGAKGRSSSSASLERFAFYERARRCFAIVATGERRLYGNVILKKGVIPPN